jgi:hypothetical protein
MWDRYKRTFVWTQLLSLGLTATVYFAAGRDWLNALAVFISCELFGVVGAWWGERLRKKILRAREPGLLRRHR